MDELLILLFRGIARMLSGENQQRKSPPAGSPAMPNVPPAWQEQIRQAMVAAQTKGQRKGRGRRPAPPPLPVALPPVIVEPTVSAPVAPAAHASTRQSPHAARADLRLWLTPAVLQRQFILTEVLQPPLALREKR